LGKDDGDVFGLGDVSYDWRRKLRMKDICGVRKE
jgi:hypothetical protein